MKLVLSSNEIKIIRIWADSTMHGGHWGDGDIVLPEERIILDKLGNTGGGELDFTPEEARIVLIWSESSRGIHTMEEESAIGKLRAVLAEGR